MKKLTGLFLLGTAVALVLAFGIPGKTNACVNCTNGNLILADGLGITFGERGIGIEVEKDRPDRDRTYDERRDYERERAYEQGRDNERQREYDQGRDYNRDRAYDREDGADR